MITIEEILNDLKNHGVSEENISTVEKAYRIAEDIHKEQFRQSGEPYIIHPLSVAKNLINMEVYDTDSLCAALLHDTIEDAPFDFRKEDVEKLINKDVAEIVDGVTKLRKLDFSTEKECMQANMRKIINGLTKDIRIILVKLADRLHNMETLDFKKPEKQMKIALETMELYVPLAYSIGAYRIKSRLEDLCLRYIDPSEYFRIKEEKEKLSEIAEDYLKEMKYKLERILLSKDIPNEIIFRAKNVWTAYNKMKKGYKIENIYDLFYLKILVREVDECFIALSCVHSNNRPINGRFKDYIYNPRTNLYQALHTTVSDSNGKLTKVKIRTYDMDKIAGFGIPALWGLGNGKGKTFEQTQTELRENCQFAKKLMEIDGTASDNEEFVKEVKSELLAEHVYVYTHTGTIIELPNGSTAMDFACEVYPHDLDIMTGIIVNGKEVSFDYVLRPNDRVQIITKGKVNHDNWEQYATTHTAKQKIKQLKKQELS